MASAAFYRRRLPCRSNPGMRSAFHMITGKPADLSMINRVGCLVLALVDKTRRGTNAPKVIPGWLIGWTERSKAWRVWFGSRRAKTLSILPGHPSPRPTGTVAAA